mmetsp:Transcript_64771/g.200541  ORF Transcript_64771/g.200541 Transcript_64771/m.200541 type:complete len:264 (+) Transcript_64771:1094-1885(+)
MPESVGDDAGGAARSCLACLVATPHVEHCVELDVLVCACRPYLRGAGRRITAHVFNVGFHGGSNHVFLPTGLLQAAWSSRSPAGGNPLAGGVVRIDGTNASDFYPGEMTELLPTHVRKLLRSAGHVGRQWGASSGPTAIDLEGGFTAFTVTALDLRRHLARARRRGHPFYLQYTRLPGKIWGPNNKDLRGASRVYYEEGGWQSRYCRLEPANGETSSCGAEELVVLPPLEASWMGALALRFFAARPYVVLPEDAPSREIPCYS